ncbi:MAG: sensor domain-containing diguanylate cyclase [Lachnospiraceae bacterium]
MKKNFFNSFCLSKDVVKKSISKRFRFINALLFLIITLTMFATMFIVLQNITNRVSREYARLYAENAVGIINTYLKGEIAIITKTAHSNALIEWFADEVNEVKKLDAYNEMMSTIVVSSGTNIYLGIANSLHEYTIEQNYTFEDLNAHAVLSKDLPNDHWYFECISDPKDYLLNVDIDKVYNRKRVWLNCKVSRDGINYGVLCTALDFSQVVEKLFSEYENQGVRSLIVDEYGNVQMDSTLLRDETFLYTLDIPHISDEILDTQLLSTINASIKPMDNYFNSESVTKVLELSNKDYQYATIAPISSTTWSVITLYNSSALFALSTLAPVFIIIAIIFIIFLLLINTSLSNMILNPLDQLIKSIQQVNGNFNERVYGLERDDEIGILATTIQNMKDSLIDALSKVHYDALTGIYNRRYFDENIRNLIATLYRSNSELSILLLDIDYFKKYNDTYGHNAGDECLKKVATILSDIITRSSDFVSRYGGEEFVIILPNTDLSGACLIAKKIIDSFEEANIPHVSSNVRNYVTVSIGVATHPISKEDTPEDYILRADKALYLSKEHGRNQFTIYKG